MSRKQVSKEERAARSARLNRAARIKCKRCKVVFKRGKNTRDSICPRCKVHCKRCDVTLTAENKSKDKYACKPCTAERVRGSNRDPSFNQREYDLLRNYGITASEYDSMLEAQNGVCWICHRGPGTKRLSVDHEHVKGEKQRDSRLKRPKVRGLLCWHCNNAIAKFNDIPDNLRRAADYLEEWPAQKILNKEKD